jgi:hypothetical protein
MKIDQNKLCDAIGRIEELKAKVTGLEKALEEKNNK